MFDLTEYYAQYSTDLSFDSLIALYLAGAGWVRCGDAWVGVCRAPPRGRGCSEKVSCLGDTPLTLTMFVMIEVRDNPTELSL